MWLLHSQSFVLFSLSDFSLFSLALSLEPHSLEISPDFLFGMLFCSPFRLDSNFFGPTLEEFLEVNGDKDILGAYNMLLSVVVLEKNSLS